MSQNTSIQALVARNNGVNAGIDKHITTNVTIGGVAYTPAALKAVFQGMTTALQTAEASHKQWANDVLTAKTATKAASGVYLSLRNYLLGLYGKTAVTVLADFGMDPPKSTTPTSATKAAAATKRAATRAARHTMGSQQKKDVTGTVAVTAPAASTTAPAPVGTPPAAVPKTV